MGKSSEGIERAAESRNPHPHALPNYEKAIVPQDKLEKYSLNPEHDKGKHKAHVFKTALGFKQTDWKTLADQILSEIPFHEAKMAGEGPWGKVYEVILPIVGSNDKMASILTAWIIKIGTDYPSLVTTYVIKREKQ